MDMPPVKMAALGSVRLLHVDVLCRSSDQGSWLYGEGGVKQGQVRVERSLFPNRCSFLKSFFHVSHVYTLAEFTHGICLLVCVCISCTGTRARVFHLGMKSERQGVHHV